MQLGLGAVLFAAHSVGGLNVAPEDSGCECHLVIYATNEIVLKEH